MIPPMTASAVLPPFVGPDPTSAADASPYLVSASELVARFCTTLERAAILRGLLSYRQAIAGLGMIEGHMWLDGSFVEDVEAVNGRSPNDIDVVIFAAIPGVDDSAKAAFVNANPTLFLADEAKKIYGCDVYFVDLSLPPLAIVNRTRYWFGLFSHQRVTRTWKGMLELPLLSDDVMAESVLRLAERRLGRQRNG